MEIKQQMMSKTQHYRKITKPLLERKRRARMNLYLDELKDLIVDTMESQGEHVTKLEKADILEMTVQYLKTKKQIDVHQSGPKVDREKFRAGYTQAAYEVSKVFSSFPGLDVNFGTKLMKHLGYQLKDFKDQSMTSVLSPNLRFLAPNQISPAHTAEMKFVVKTFPSPSESVKTNEPQETDVWRPW